MGFRCRTLGRLIFLLAGAVGCLQASGRTVTSVDGTVSISLPEDWQLNAPAEGPVKLLLAGDGDAVTVTILREPLGTGTAPSPVRLLFLKLDNFGQDFPVEEQTTPMPVFIDGEEAARVEFVSEIRQANGARVKSAFVFTCLTRGGFLYTIVGSARADEMNAWRPVLDAVAASLDIR